MGQPYGLPPKPDALTESVPTLVSRSQCLTRRTELSHFRKVYAMRRTIMLVGLGLICTACVRMGWWDLVAPAGMTVAESDRAGYECQRDGMFMPKNRPRSA